MTQQHPIAPPPELVRHWSRFQGDTDPEALWFRIANEAAQWGADQQLELDARWLDHNALNETHLKITPIGDVLKEAMRPKPPSLKKQALAALDDAVMRGDCITISDALPTIRRALEQLDD